MRRLIAISLSLLCIVLPLRAVADAAAANGNHCPMMQAQSDQQAPIQAEPHADVHPISHAQATSAGSHDCCNDADTAARTGQLCKMGQECTAPMTYLLPPSMLQQGVATQRIFFASLPVTLHTRPPAAVWRPPSLT
jgi:hypothetical protein